VYGLLSSDVMARVALPNTGIEEQVRTCGIGLITLLGEDFYNEISSILEKSTGKRWLEEIQMKVQGLNHLNLLDTSTLLKVILRPDYPLLREKIREAINTRIEKIQRQDFYNRLDSVLDDRNQWVHNQVKGTRLNLIELIEDLDWIAKRMNLKVLEECEQLKLLLVQETESSGETGTLSNSISKVLDDLKGITNAEEPSIGSEIVDPFLDYSYTLQLSGEIRDRKTDLLLSQLIGSRAEAVGTLFLARKPSGGRLRVTSAGEVAAYFEGKWGYLARVSPTDWFTNHLDS
jgi:hypothetical protein